MKIIINADDFGVNSLVNQEIERFIDLGVVTSTTIMANGTCLEDVKRIYDKHPEISFGIHLCLSEFGSLSKSPIFFKYGLTDITGRFIKQSIWNCKSFQNDLKQAIYEELCMQIELVQSLGINISHADSHHLVHTTFPELQSLFIEVLQKYHIRKVRIGKIVNPCQVIIMHVKEIRTVSGDSNPQLFGGISTSYKHSGSLLYKIQHLFKAWLISVRINKIYKKNFVTTDYFKSADEVLSDIYGFSKSEGIFELMCHPGHFSKRYTLEAESLLSTNFATINDLQLLSYKEL